MEPMNTVKLLLVVISTVVFLYSSGAAGGGKKKQNGKDTSNPKEIRNLNNGSSTSAFEIPIDSALGSLSISGTGSTGSTQEGPGYSGKNRPSIAGVWKHTLIDIENTKYSYIGRTATVRIRPQDVYDYVFGIGSLMTMDTFDRWARTISHDNVVETFNYDTVLYDFHIKPMNHSMVHYGVTENAGSVELAVNERIMLCAQITATPKDPSRNTSEGMSCVRLQPGFGVTLRSTFTPAKGAKVRKGVIDVEGSVTPIGLRWSIITFPQINEQVDRLHIGFQMGMFFRFINELALQEAVDEMNEQFGQKKGTIDVNVRTEVLSVQWDPMDKEEQEEQDRLNKFLTGRYSI